MKLKPERLARICSLCNKRFIPTGKYQKLCMVCRCKSNKIKMREWNIT